MDNVFFIEEFVDYRKKEAEEAAALIRKLLKDSPQISGDYFKGAMFMLSAIINLPVKLAKDEKEMERAKQVKEQMLNQLEAKLMRKFLEED